MKPFDRIAAVIRRLDRRWDDQPGFEELAASVGLSPSRFHRLFVDWAGVPPKAFLQCLTHAHARARLLRGEDVLSTALESGHSGPGRLHDLCVTLESASPGEIKSGGAGLEMTFGFAGSPFGDCFVAASTRGLCRLRFLDGEGPEQASVEFMQEWPNASHRRDDRWAGALMRDLIRSEGGGALPLRAWVKGSVFQLRVWRALLEIPSGSLTSYGRLASAIGEPRAARAVGAAVGANPVAWLIPCHRVIRETGVIGGYRWGGERKRALIAWESLST